MAAQTDMQKYEDDLENAFQNRCRGYDKRPHPEADPEGSRRRL